MRLAPFIDPPNLGAALGDDPPAILVDAIGEYRAAYNATRAEERRLAEANKKKPRK